MKKIRVFISITILFLATACTIKLNVALPPGLSNLPGKLRELVTPEPTSTLTPAMTREEFEAEFIRLVNAERVKVGLPPFEVDQGLMEFARARSEDMVTRGYFSHYDPQTGDRLSGDAGENITKLTFTAHLSRRAVVKALSNFMNSEPHRNNILSDCTKTGVGVAVGQDYIIVTQLFSY